MKTVAIVLLLAMTSASAWAKVESGSGTHRSEAQACSDAKLDAQVKCKGPGYQGGDVQKYGRCECSEERAPNNSAVTTWTCTVDAYCSDGRPSVADEIRRSLSNSNTK